MTNNNTTSNKKYHVADNGKGGFLNWNGQWYSHDFNGLRQSTQKIFMKGSKGANSLPPGFSLKEITAEEACNNLRDTQPSRKILSPNGLSTASGRPLPRKNHIGKFLISSAARNWKCTTEMKPPGLYWVRRIWT